MSLKSLAGYALLAWASSQIIVTVSAAAVECSLTSAVTTTTSSSSSISSSNTNPTTTIIATATATNYGLNDAAKEAGKLWFGTAADIPATGEADDLYYMAEFNNTHDFGGATPANIMKVGIIVYRWGKGYIGYTH